MLWLWVGWAIGLGWTVTYRSFHQLTLPLGQPLTIIGTVSDAPDVRQSRTYLTVQPDGQHSALLVKMPRLNHYRYGDRLRFVGTVVAPEAINGFDYPRYLERFGIGGTIRQPSSVTYLGYAPPNWVVAHLYALRDVIEQQINRQVPEPEASFLSGLLLGSRRAIPQEIQIQLQRTGTSHLTAISGENISLMLLILLKLVPVASVRGKWWVTLFIATVISVMTGLCSSVVRGAVMACAAAYLRMSSRKIWPVPLLLVSLSGMLLFNPLLLADDPGFQLSFAAITGLFLFSTPIQVLLSRWPLTLLPEAIQSGLAETLAAMTGTLPLDLKLFGQLPLLGLAVNPLVLWLIFPITLIGLLIVAFGWIAPLAWLLALPAWLLLHAVLAIIAWFASLPFGLIHLSISWWVVAVLYGLGVLLHFTLKRNA